MLSTFVFNAFASLNKVFVEVDVKSPLSNLAIRFRETPDNCANFSCEIPNFSLCSLILNFMRSPPSAYSLKL